MAMSMGSFATRTVATVVVATDGTGDFTDIQDGIDSLPATGGCVYIKEGTYTITVAIDINKNNVGIFGCGKASKIYTINSIKMMTAANKSGITIRDLYFNTDSIGNGAEPAATRFDSCSNCSVRNVWIEKIYSGIQVANCNDVHIISCWIKETAWYGVFVIASNDTKIVNNYIEKGNAYGILLRFMLPDISHRSIVTGNYVKDCYNGIHVYGTDNSIISNNICDSNTNDGIVVSGNSNNNVISGNACLSNTNIGINIAGATDDNNIVVGNQCILNGTQIFDGGTGTERAHNKTE